MYQISKLLREPLLHFFLLGAGLFLLSGFVGESDQDQPDRIVVNASQIERLIEGWKKTRMRPPTIAELDGLIEDHIREEIYYRQALAMGLDRDDTIVRRRLRQKMEFLSQDLAARVDPTESELQAYLEENEDSFRLEPRIGFRHIYFNRDRRGARAHPDALHLLARLRGDDGTIDIATSGDPLPLPHDYESLPEREVINLFGRDFAAQLLSLAPGAWQGPLMSGYGLHLVFIRERTASKTPALALVRDAVSREWREARRQATNDELYQQLRERYTVVVERPRLLNPDTKLAEVAQP